ncbi:MAG TPA: helix-turn-helix domain-containing protein [Alicyclobacillus sp.]|nr:helix-turn-helix domain-containing protein [Alicyclobacillus sp.]
MKVNSIDTFDGSEYDGDRERDKPMRQTAAVEQTTKLGGNWVTTGEAKKMLGVSSVNTVKRWVAEGKLEARKFGETGWMRISVESIQRLLRSGDKNVQAFQNLKRRADAMADLDFDLTEEDLDAMSDRQMGQLPWKEEKKETEK